jgi:hypothetical protein
MIAIRGLVEIFFLRLKYNNKDAKSVVEMNGRGRKTTNSFKRFTRL